MEIKQIWESQSSQEMSGGYQRSGVLRNVYQMEPKHDGRVCLCASLSQMFVLLTGRTFISHPVLCTIPPDHWTISQYATQQHYAL